MGAVHVRVVRAWASHLQHAARVASVFLVQDPAATAVNFIVIPPAVADHTKMHLVCFRGMGVRLPKTEEI